MMEHMVSFRVKNENQTIKNTGAAVLATIALKERMPSIREAILGRTF
jgi:hypothetical protein